MSEAPPGGAGRAGLLDAHGCLTAAGVVALQSAPPGGAPRDLALHVAGCGRCQQKLLESATANDPLKRGKGKARPLAPSLGRTVLLAGLVLVAILFFLYTLRQLTGR
jgi:hypothetical protein